MHISVPTLALASYDDFLVENPSLHAMGYVLANPNIIVVKTKCGGHLGWQEARPGGGIVGKSWAGDAMVDFIQAVLDDRRAERQKKNSIKVNTRGSTDDRHVEDIYSLRKIRSKL